MTVVPHVLDLARESAAAAAAERIQAVKVDRRTDIVGIIDYLTDDDATAARHFWFHGPELERVFPPHPVSYSTHAGGFMLPTRPAVVTAGVAADRALITWRHMLQQHPITDATNLPNPRLDARASDAELNNPVGSSTYGHESRGATVFGLLTDWQSLPALDPSQPWQGHAAFRPHPELAPRPLSDICNPLVEVFRCNAAINATPNAKGTVHRALRDAAAGWTPQAVDYFNSEVGHVNAAVAAIIERINQ